MLQTTGWAAGFGHLLERLYWIRSVEIAAGVGKGNRNSVSEVTNWIWTSKHTDWNSAGYTPYCNTYPADMTIRFNAATQQNNTWYHCECGSPSVYKEINLGKDHLNIYLIEANMLIDEHIFVTPDGTIYVE
jgi:hypothetical protein